MAINENIETQDSFTFYIELLSWLIKQQRVHKKVFRNSKEVACIICITALPYLKTLVL